MQLEFIHQDANNRKLTDLDRRTIRRISRKVGAATRKEKTVDLKPNSGKQTHTGDQAPVRAPAVKAPSALKQQRSNLKGHKHQLSLDSIASPLSLATISNDFPTEVFILVQPDLITKLLGIAAVTDALSNPYRWLKICRLAQESVVQALPQRYGRSGCLDDAIACVSGRIRQCLVAGQDKQLCQRDVETSYLRALRSLQTKLGSSDSVSWDVWYATLLLCLFELLEYNDLRNYVCHARGGFNVLHALGPANITTEEEKDLLIAQAEIMVLEATFADVDCFLSDPDWQRALDSTIIPHVLVHDRSEAVVSLWKINAFAPGLFKRVTNVVVHQSIEDKGTIVKELHALLDKYTDWSLQWDWVLAAEEPPEPTGDQEFELSLRRSKVLTRYLVYFALASRFLIAIDPESASYAESAATTAAAWIVQIAEPKTVDSVPGVGMKVALLLAKSILSTTAQWSHPKGLKTIEPRIFINWCQMIGRAT